MEKPVITPKIAQNASSQQQIAQEQKAKPFLKIPTEDKRWARQQSFTVMALWLDCWESDPYGSQWMPLETTLKNDNLRKAVLLQKPVEARTPPIGGGDRGRGRGRGRG